MAYQTLGSTRQIPVIGKSIARIGQVIDIVAEPCTPDPLVMVTAVWHDVPHLLFSLFKPDAQDLVVERAGIKHKRKPKRGFNIFDALKDTAPMPKGKAGTAVFHLGHMAERIGWYMLVADATTNFLVNWTSTVYEWSGCEVPGTPYAQVTGHEGYLFYAEGEYEVLPMWRNIQNHPPFGASFGAVFSPPGYDTTLTCSIRYTTHAGALGGPGEISEFIVYDSYTMEIVGRGPAQDLGNGNHYFSVQRKNWDLINPAHSWSVDAVVTKKGYFSFEGSLMTLYGHKDKGLISDP